MEVAEIKFTQGEANDLLVIIDAGVRHRGLDVAAAALSLSAKIKKAFQIELKDNEVQKTNTNNNIPSDDNN